MSLFTDPEFSNDDIYLFLYCYLFNTFLFIYLSILSSVDIVSLCLPSD